MLWRNAKRCIVCNSKIDPRRQTVRFLRLYFRDDVCSVRCLKHTIKTSLGVIDSNHDELNHFACECDTSISLCGAPFNGVGYALDQDSLDIDDCIVCMSLTSCSRCGCSIEARYTC